MSIFYCWLGFQGVFVRDRENKRLAVLCWHFGAVWKWERSRSDVVISPFMGKSNVSAWMSITKHTGTHPTYSVHSLDTCRAFVVAIVGQKVEDNLLLPYSQIYLQWNEESSGLKVTKIPNLCISLSFPSFQAIILITTQHNELILNYIMGSHL